MGQIDKIQALYHIKYTLITIFHEYIFLLIWSILETRAKNVKNFVGFLQYGKLWQYGL